MKKKRYFTIFSILLVCGLLISVSAYESYENIPSSINLKCGETYTETFNFPSAVDYELETIDIYLNYILALTQTSQNYLQISLFPKSNYSCVSGSGDFDFEVNSEDYTIILNVTKDLWDLGEYNLEEGNKITIGGAFDFNLITTSEGRIRYSLEGCGEDKDDFLINGDSFEATCDGETLKFELVGSYDSPFSFAKLNIYSSESGYNVVKEEVSEDSECVLGLDTLGAKVKRGNIFAIKTINVNDNKAVSGVSVTILDQEGELSPINDVSSSTGFFNQRLHEDYGQDLIVELQKDGCEPSTQVILFEMTYNDYIEEKELEENTFTLKMILENESLEGIVTNLLDEVIEGVSVKLTNPNGISSEQITDINGKFSFEQSGYGVYKFQAGKENYQSTELIEFELKSKEYTISFFVLGDEKREFMKGDSITMKVYDNENNILPLNFDAVLTLDNGDEEIVQFTNGVSEKYEFVENAELIVPSMDGYNEQVFFLEQKQSQLDKKYLFIGLGVLILIILLFAIFSKKGNKSSLQNQLNVPLSPGE